MSRLWRCNIAFSNTFGGRLNPVLGPDIIGYMAIRGLIGLACLADGIQKPKDTEP